MAIKKIVIDDKTQVKPLDGNKIQLDLVAFPLNEENQKEPDTELKIFINNQLLQNLTSDLQGNIKESLIISGNGEEIIIKLQDIKSCTISDIKTLMLGGKKEKKNDNALEKEKYIAQLKINPNGVVQLPEWARNDPEIVKYALEQDWELLEYVSDELKNKKEIVWISLNKNPKSFIYISDILKTDEDFIVECIEKFGDIFLQYVSNYIKNTPKVSNAIKKMQNMDDIIGIKRYIQKNGVSNMTQENIKTLTKYIENESSILAEILDIMLEFNQKKPYYIFSCNIYMFIQSLLKNLNKIDFFEKQETKAMFIEILNREDIEVSARSNVLLNIFHQIRLLIGGQKGNDEKIIKIIAKITLNIDDKIIMEIKKNLGRREAWMLEDEFYNKMMLYKYPLGENKDEWIIFVKKYYPKIFD